MSLIPQMWMSAWHWMGPANTFASTLRDLSSAPAGPATSCTLMVTPVWVSHIWNSSTSHCCLPAHFNHLERLIHLHAAETMNTSPHLLHFSVWVCLSKVDVLGLKWNQTQLRISYIAEFRAYSVKFRHGGQNVSSSIHFCVYGLIMLWWCRLQRDLEKIVLQTESSSRVNFWGKTTWLHAVVANQLIGWSDWVELNLPATREHKDLHSPTATHTCSDHPNAWFGLKWPKSCPKKMFTLSVCVCECVCTQTLMNVSCRTVAALTPAATPQEDMLATAPLLCC